MEHADTAQLAAVGGALGCCARPARARAADAARRPACCWRPPRRGWRCRSATRRSTSSRARPAPARRSPALLAARRAPPPCWPGGPRCVSVACCWRRRSARRSTSTAPTASWCRSPRTAGSAACCRSTSCSAAAAAALGWRALRGRPVRALPPVIALPAAAFFALAFLSLLWADDVEAGTNLLAFFTLPFAALLATVARADFPDFVPRALAAVALGAGVAVRRGRAVAGGHPQAVLLRAQPGRLERQHRLLPRHVPVRRPEPVRAPRGAGHRRGAGAAARRPLAHLAADRPGRR